MAVRYNFRYKEHIKIVEVAGLAMNHIEIGLGGLNQSWRSPQRLTTQSTRLQLEAQVGILPNTLQIEIGMSTGLSGRFRADSRLLNIDQL